MSLLETIVFLGIVAGVMGMLAASLANGHDTDPRTFERIAEFVRDTRLTAIERGEGVLLVASAQSLRSSARRLDWSGDATLRIGDAELTDPASPEIRILVDADGAIEASPIHVVEPGRDRAVPAVYRAPVVTP